MHRQILNPVRVFVFFFFFTSLPLMLLVAHSSNSHCHIYFMCRRKASLFHTIISSERHSSGLYTGELIRLLNEQPVDYSLGNSLSLGIIFYEIKFCPLFFFFNSHETGIFNGERSYTLIFMCAQSLSKEINNVRARRGSLACRSDSIAPIFRFYSHGRYTEEENRMI